MKIKQTKHTLSGYVSSAFSHPLSIFLSLSRRINVSYLIQHGRRAFCCDRQCAKYNKKKRVRLLFLLFLNAQNKRLAPNNIINITSLKEIHL